MSAAGREFDCLIVGAGVTATVMAGVLLHRGLAASGRVALIADPVASREASSFAEADWDLRVFALSRASQRLLMTCGVWSSLPVQKRFAYERMCVWDASGAPQGAGSLTFDCAELGEPNLGFIVEGRALQAESMRAAAAAGAVFIDGAVAALGVEAAGIRLSLADGREFHAPLAIGADGVDSRTRALLGIETAGHTYHQDALVAHVRTAKPHVNTAWQRFLPTGPLAFLPLPDGRSSLVWSTTRAEAARLRALEPAAFAAELTVASGEVLGACELTTPVASFPLKLQYALDYVTSRAVLVGDAAHVVHPLAGQGLNLGLLDCAALAEVLGEAGGAEGYGDARVLRRYERWRRSENLLTATALDGLERLFANRHPSITALRVAGLGAVGRAPFIKRRLAERALGIAGDVPGFLRKAIP